MFIYLLFQLRTRQAETEIVGSYSRVFTVWCRVRRGVIWSQKYKVNDVKLKQDKGHRQVFVKILTADVK